MEDKSYVSLSELFERFQTIKNVENDLIVTNLETPNFAMHVENIMKKKTRIGDELKIFKEKLEKVLTSDLNDRQKRLKFSKVDNKTTLWELFQKTSMTTEENTDRKSNSRNKMELNITDNSCALVNNKLQKILRMLHMVYPEASAISQKYQNMWKYVTNRNQMTSEDIVKIPNYETISEMCENHTKSMVVDTNWKRECWIKSDAEYLILEVL